jgi:stage V sporulation protein SpoVS
MSVVVPFFLIAPLVLAPLGLRLLAIATPGAEPPRAARSAVVPAALLLTLSYILAPGVVAALLSLPWLGLTAGVALVAGLRLLKDPDRFRPDVRHATDAALAFLAVGATFATIDRLGARPLDFTPEVILLTAVHFHFAGFVLPLAGALAHGRRPSRWLELALGAVILGIPITALGFIGVPSAAWIGALLTATGGFGIGVATVLVARGLRPRRATTLAAVAGASLLVSMPMAAIHATGTLIGTSWIDIATMARIHGGLNALGFALPVILAWTFDRRTREVRPDRPPLRDPRRLGLGAAGIIAGYALFIAGISANAFASQGEVGFTPPSGVARPIVLGVLCMLPALVAAIGAIRRSHLLLIAAGALAIAQSFIAFSGVTLPFLVPAFLLLALGAEGRAGGLPRRVVLSGVLVVILGLGAWIAPFAMTQTSCWLARTGPGGEIVYSPVPVTETLTVGPSDVGSGCDGGALTIQGVALAAVLGIGAVSVALLASAVPPSTRPPVQEPA